MGCDDVTVVVGVMGWYVLYGSVYAVYTVHSIWHTCTINRPVLLVVMYNQFFYYKKLTKILSLKFLNLLPKLVIQMLVINC